MAKYIGTYTNETAIQTALNNNELNRPFVALANDTKQVYYGPYLDLAQIGDIVVYDTARTSLRFIHLADYNTTTYPTATYEPIGVVCENQTATLASGASDVKMLSKYWMDKNNPDVGTTNNFSRIKFSIGYTIQNTSSTDGKTNTTNCLALATGQTDWQTATTIEYLSNTSPVCECAWRYHTSGTNQGDWYIGAVDEILNTLTTTNGTLINSGLTAIGGPSYYGSGGSYDTVWTSTNDNQAMMKGVRTNGIGETTKNSDSEFYARALYKGTILPM